MTADVVVVGSLNRDVRIEVERRPAPGETVLATEVVGSNGGKGGNQAVAAARAGAVVRMVGAVGDDLHGREQLTELTRFGVDVTAVRRGLGRHTGRAFIVVTPDGENSIVVHAGANTLVDPGTPAQYRGSRVVVVQTEIGRRIAEEAAEAARAAGARLVVNAAPVVPLDSSLYRGTDPLVVNVHEARELAGDHPEDPHQSAAADADLVLAAAVRNRCGARSVVVTLGGRGAVVVDDRAAAAIPPVPVPRVVDTTGAGDTFVGALAARLAAGDGLTAAAGAAAAQAAAAVRWPGARPEPV